MTVPSLQHDARGYMLGDDQGQMLENLRTRLLATGSQSGGTMTALECVNPGPGGPPLHTHHAHDEFYFVVQGRYRFKIGDLESDGGPETFAYVPRGVVHTFASIGPEEGRLFSVSLPSGLEHFLEGMNELIVRGATTEEIEALHRQYDSEVNGPPLVSG